MNKRFSILFSLLFLLFLSSINGAYYDNNHPQWIKDQGLRNNDMYKSGFIDVTWYDGWQGNRVDPTGRVDSLWAMEKAIEDALRYDLAVYIPSGTYLVSDTLSIRSNGNNINRADKCAGPNGDISSIIGNQDDRPLIKLMNNADGFDDKNNPKHIVAMWTWGNDVCGDSLQKGSINIRGEDFTIRAANGFKQLFKNIDIDIGTGNPGAIGLNYDAAQGSTVENVRINARDGYAAFYDIPTRSTGAINIEAIGGDYGVIMRNGPTPVITGLKLKDQRIAGISVNTESPLTVIGLEAESNGAPIFKHMPVGYFQSGAGSASIIDAKIEMKNGGTVIDNNKGRNFYLENVYVEGADVLVNSEGERTNPVGTWSHIREYSFVSKDVQSGLRTRSGGKVQWGSAESWSMKDGGELNKDTIEDIVSSSEPTTNFIARNIPSIDPFFLDSDVTNAVTDLGIDNTGSTDISSQLQAALDEHKNIFLPTGKYKIRKTINMPKDSKLFGHNYDHTIIISDQRWDPISPVPMIRTVNDKDGRIFIGEILFERSMENLEHSYFGVFEFRSGNSVLKKIDTEPHDFWHSDQYNVREVGNDNVYDYKFSGNAGGSIYTLHSGKDARTNGDGFNRLVFEGTYNPLTFYGFNAEHAASSPFVRIDDSRNIRILGIKTECSHEYMNILNSENIGIYNYGVGCHPKDKKPSITIKDSEDIKFVNMGNRVYMSGSPMIQEDYFGEVNEMPAESLVSKFERGDFNQEVFYGSHSQSSGSTCSAQIGPGDPLGTEFYGAPYDPDTNEIEFDGTCSTNKLYLDIFSEGTSIVYQYGYYWDGTQWVKFTYGGERIGDSVWLKHSASRSLSGLDLDEKVFVVAYICDKVNDEWKCGCKDSACETSYWNLQIFDDPTNSNPVSS